MSTQSRDGGYDQVVVGLQHAAKLVSSHLARTVYQESDCATSITLEEPIQGHGCQSSALVCNHWPIDGRPGGFRMERMDPCLPYDIPEGYGMKVVTSGVQ